MCIRDSDSSAILLLIKNMNHNGNGNFDENIVDLNTKTTIDSLSMASGGIKLSLIHI